MSYGFTSQKYVIFETFFLANLLAQHMNKMTHKKQT